MLRHSTPHLAFDSYAGSWLHLGVTGSVAAYKALELLRLFAETGARVSATLTRGAQEFVTPLSFEALGASPVYGEMFAAGSQNTFAHLEPGQEAQALLICPASADIMAKLAHGLADDMLSCQALAFDGPVILAPAMNTRMWNAAATRHNLATLQERGVRCITPETGSLACGTQGQGRLATLERIMLEGLRAVTPQDLAGRTILLTLGPTQEYFDCVRYWSNPSTGSMGGALAVSAWLRGARVLAVCGPCSVWLPELADISQLFATGACTDGIYRVNVVSAREMYEAVMDLWQTHCLTNEGSWACLSAAVADFSPQPYADPQTGKKTKYKKAQQAGLEVSFDKNPDILASLGASQQDKTARGIKLAGFAAESANPEEQCRKKLQQKHLDLIIGNDITAPGCGFGSSTNGVTVLDAAGRLETWPVLPKTEVAWRIWDWMLHL